MKHELERRYSLSFYQQFFPEIEEILSQKYGNGKWNMKVFHEIASGTDPDRKKFSQLKAEIQAGCVDVVVTMRVYYRF